MNNTFTEMRDWRISRSSLFVLYIVLVVITLVLILPQVDLLDTAFHLGTAPIVVHSQFTAKSFSRTIKMLVSFSSYAIAIAFLSLQQFLDNPFPEAIPLLSRTLRC